MIGKEIDKNEEEDLQDLIDNQVLEHKTIVGFQFNFDG